MTDLELADAITSLLPDDYREKLRGTLERFEKTMEQTKLDTKESNECFCRYMDSEWRKRAKEMLQRLQRKAVTA